MSGIVGSYFNTRGSGVVAKLGTDGQVFTSTGAGLSQGFEAAAGGGKILQLVVSLTTTQVSTTSTSFTGSGLTRAITPSDTSSTILAMFSSTSQVGGSVGSVNLYNGSALVSASAHGLAALEQSNVNIPISFVHLDAPATISEITYEVYYKNDGGSSMYLSTNDAESTLILLEIGA
jgi:hypothetical protein